MNETEILQIILSELHDKLNAIRNSTARDTSFANAANKIKVAVGIRRSGKTVFYLSKHFATTRQKHPAIAHTLHQL